MKNWRNKKEEGFFMERNLYTNKSSIACWLLNNNKKEEQAGKCLFPFF